MKRTYQPSKRKHQKVHGFFLEEERKAERFYPHRNHRLGDFFV
ncbi:large ribosomal subunit protein bL34 [Faecalitalea cylindroides]|nr:50S ribosomal protein L34 [Faecalitalea cylindroides]